MADTEKNGINWEKVFSTSIKITAPYITGLAIGSRYMKHNMDWVDIMIQGILVFGTCYLVGASLNGIYNTINKRLTEYKNNQKSR